MSDAHDSHHVNYLYVFLAICVFTVLSILFDVVDIRHEESLLGIEGLSGHTVLVIGIFAVATAKALCVLAFFMHLKFEGNWKYLLLAPTTVLAIGLPIALLPDVGVHYYTVDVPQLEDRRRELAAEAAHAEQTPADEPEDETTDH